MFIMACWLVGLLEKYNINECNQVLFWWSLSSLGGRQLVGQVFFCYSSAWLVLFCIGLILLFIEVIEVLVSPYVLVLVLQFSFILSLFSSNPIYYTSLCLRSYIFHCGGLLYWLSFSQVVSKWQVWRIRSCIPVQYCGA